MRRPESLRAQLLLWMVVPIAVVAALDAITSYGAAVESATIVQERMLLGAARVIGEEVRMEDGVLQVLVPPAALEMFASPSRDRVFYRATDDRDALLTGYFDLPLPPHRPRSEEATYFDAVLRDRPIHVVAYSQPLLAAPERGSVLIEVGQTLDGRDALARDIWLAAARRQLLLVAVMAILLWLGLGRGVRPVLHLRDRMLARQPGSVEPLDEKAVPLELQPLVSAVNDYAERLDRHMSAHSRFIADASHQLRTPLTLLNTQVSYAMRNDDPALREEALHAIQASVQHGIRLVKQLLAFTTAEAGPQGAGASEPVDLVALATTVLEREAWLAQERAIDLGFESDAPQAHVNGQRQLLTELVANLVDNAVRYTQPGGRVTVSVRAGGERSTLVVEDNGPGVPPEQRERVFERFFRLDNGQSDGCGLGLAIVREIARAHGARVSLADAPSGRGLAAVVVFDAQPSPV
jgi:two-component system, OmpR family, sensor histidine kinase TctE